MYTTDGEGSTGFSAFKAKEKFFKYYADKKTDFSQCVNLDSLDSDSKIEQFTVQHPRTGKIVKGFKFPKPSGLIVLKNYTEPYLQLELCRRAINEYHRKPHRTNLYIYEKEESQAKQNDPDKEKMVKHDAREYNKDHFLVSDANRYHFNSKIRWSNLGRQYNWDKRDYFVKESPILPELNDIAVEVIKLLSLDNYKPEALIVNYYGWRNFMGGHLDDGEPDQQHPIVSLSFGLSCVFLIGGRTKDIEPYAVRLDSGDVMVMSEESRRCYHGKLV